MQTNQKKDAKSIKIGDIQEDITKVSTDDNFIKLELNNNVEAFAYPNYFEVINEGE